MWITEIDFPIHEKDEVASVMSDINGRDKTFVWSISYSGNACKLTVKSESKDRAHKRGLWLISNVESLRKSEGYKARLCVAELQEVVGDE